MSFYVMQGYVFHSRQETAKNSFKYPIFNFYFATENAESVFKEIRRKTKNIFSISAFDYLPVSPEFKTFDSRIKNFLLTKFGYKADKIFLQTIPKMFGYAFNPVSFWYCFSGAKLDAVLCEVNNTFGETHYYWMHNQGSDLNGQWLVANKEFHVSPFFDITGKYKFRFFSTSDRIHVDIQFLNNDDSLKLNTWVSGKLNAIQELSLPGLILKYGWMTPMVVLRIHLQAIRLFFKRVEFFSKPVPPKEEVTNGQTINCR